MARNLDRERAAADRGPDGDLLTVLLATAARMANAASEALRVSGVSRAIDTVIASMSAIPAKIALATAPVAPKVSPIARPGR